MVKWAPMCLVAACALAACGDSTRTLGATTYRETIVQIGDQIFERIAEARKTPDPCPRGLNDELELELRQAQLARSASTWAVSRLQDISPPHMYAPGHALLIRYYERSATYSALEARVLEG